MNRFTFEIGIVVAFFVGLWIYKRRRSPELLNEVENLMRLLSERDAARGDPERATEFSEMSNAIYDARRYLAHRMEVYDTDRRFIASRLKGAFAPHVLDAIGLFEPNHRHACSEAIIYLCGRFEKAYPVSWGKR
jgi:hypothetical protein